MKQRNPTWGCPRIAQQVTLAFGIEIDKDVVRRIMAVHFRRAPGTGGPSWLTFLGHMKDSLWSVDLFRCESATLRTHWVLVVMDQYTRKIIGFGMHAGIVDGMSLCRMFQQAIRSLPAPEYLSSDNDPLFRFHQWQARSSPRNRPKVSSSKSSVAGRDRVGTGFPASTDSIVDCRYVQKLLGSATVRAHIALRHAQVLQELELIVAAVFDTQSASEN